MLSAAEASGNPQAPENVLESCERHSLLKEKG